MLGSFFLANIDNLYFCDFGLYLDFIKVYLALIRIIIWFWLNKNKKIVFFLIKWAREPTRLIHQPAVGRVGLKFFWLANKWAGLGWLTKWSTCGRSSQVGPSYLFWQL